MQKKTTITLLSILLGVCLCLILLLGGVYYVSSRLQAFLPTLAALPSLPQNNPTPTFFEITRQPAAEVPQDSLHLLEQTDIPPNDYNDLACRLKAICNIPATLPAPSADHQVGEQDHFWVTNQDTTQSFQVTATLRDITPHAYFWVENSIDAQDGDIRGLTEAFETKIYPTDRAFFGSEWTPGIDGDVHIYILYTHGMGTGVAGYFSSDDEYNPLVRRYSNGHEMFLINSEVTKAKDAYTYGTLAHEFEHMIEWRQHPNEPSWISEGSAVLASFLNGYDPGGFDRIFIRYPDTQLDDWPNEPDKTTADLPNYGAGFLFMDYLFNRYGEPAIQDLLGAKPSGLEGVDQALRDLKAVDAQTGQVITSDDLFMDWAVTNYVQDASVGDGRYQYQNYPKVPRAQATETIPTCPLPPASRTVHQYGTDYLRITCPGSHTLSFRGATTTRLLPADPHSGSSAFWSNKGDSSDMTLTHAFDLTQVAAPIQFTYWTWYDLEKDWDYVYLEASSDGQHWQVLTTPSGTGQDPNGSSFGLGYTGKSNGWIQESVDLSQFAGQEVLLRFEYVTDLAINGEGFLLDDVSIPAIQYENDFENDDGGWQAAGFARIENVLPQTFRLALVSRLKNSTTVQIVPLGADQTAEIPLDIGPDGAQEVVLVVAGTTRFTRTSAAYQIEIH